MINKKPVGFVSFHYINRKGEGYGVCEIYEKINSREMLLDTLANIEKGNNLKHATILSVIYYDDAK